MDSYELKVSKLTEFIQRDKFSLLSWKERGLNPSSDELCQYLNSLVSG